MMPTTQRPFLACLRLLTRLFLLAPLVLGACQAPLGNNPMGYETVYLSESKLERSQPADVALAPIRNQTTATDIPLQALRAEFQRGLVGRLYTPLDTAFVDQHTAEASFSGAPPPDATLVVSLIQWNTNGLASKGHLVAGAELHLFEGGSAGGPLLWSARITRTINVGDPRREVQERSRELLPRALRAFAEELMEVLPERDAMAAHR